MQDSKVYYIYADHLNTPRRVATSEDNTIVWKWESKPFGEDKPTGTYELNLRFPGQYFDKESGFSYNINRYYNPILGRYMQSDPIGLEGGENSFVYVGDNPLVRVDERGEFFDKILGGIGGGVGTALEPGGGTAVGTAVGYAAGKWLDRWIVKKMIQLGLSRVESEVVEEEKSNDEKIALYRVVEQGEYDDLIKTQQFRTVTGHNEMKQFWLTLESAETYINMTSKFGKPYAIIRIIISKKTASLGYVAPMDGMDAITFYEGVLPLLNADMRLNGGIEVVRKL